MAAMNVVHMRVKPGQAGAFEKMHSDFDIKAMPGCRSFAAVRSGERDYIIVGEWASMEALAAARATMIGNLDRLRPLLEDLGGGRGVTEPWSGEVAVQQKA